MNHSRPRRTDPSHFQEAEDNYTHTQWISQACKCVGKVNSHIFWNDMDSRGHIVYGTDFSHGKVLFILLSKIVFLPGKPMGREACWTTVHGVAKSRTQLSDYTRTHTPQMGKCGRIPSTQRPCSRPVLRDRKQNRGDQRLGARQQRVTVLWIWPTSPRKYMPVCRLISS